MLPGGKVEGGEPPTSAAVREAKEEIGVTIHEKDLEAVHVMYRAPHDESGEWVDFFFKTSVWTGEPSNAEPEKCDKLEWFSYQSLSEAIPPYIVIALRNSRAGIIYSEVDWESK